MLDAVNFSQVLVAGLAAQSFVPAVAALPGDVKGPESPHQNPCSSFIMISGRHSARQGAW